MGEDTVAVVVGAISAELLDDDITLGQSIPGNVNYCIMYSHNYNYY